MNIYRANKDLSPVWIFYVIVLATNFTFKYFVSVLYHRFLCIFIFAGEFLFLGGCSYAAPAQELMLEEMPQPKGNQT